MVQPENFALYGTLVALALFLAGRGLKGHPGRSRSPGPAPAPRRSPATRACSCWARWASCSWATAGGRRARPDAVACPLAAALGAVALFVAVVAPWYARQYATFGSFSPSTATGKVLFMRDFSEWNSITTPATLDHLLGMGLGPLLMTRVTGFTLSLVLFAVFIAARRPGAVPRHRRLAAAARGPVRHRLRVRGAAARVLHDPGAHPRPRRQLVHAAVGLAPHAYVLALEGAAVVAAWIARRRPGRNATALTRLFVGALVAFCVATAVWSVRDVQAGWATQAAQARTTAAPSTPPGAGPRRIGSCRSTPPA